MFDISTNLPSWLIVLALLIGVVYAIFLYQKEDKIENDWLKRTLFLFRMLAVSFLCFLLLGPLVNSYIKEKEKPIIIVAQDASSSLKETDIFGQLSDFTNKVENDFEVFSFHFSDDLQEGLSVENRGEQTNYAAFFDEVESKFMGRNVAALVVATDGLYNVGENPIYKANATVFPLFPIAFGDSIQQKDLRIKNVEYNEIVFLGNDFPVEVMIAAHSCKNKNIELKLFDGERLLHKEKIKIKSTDFHHKIPLTIYAKQKGLQQYKLQLSNIEGEKNTINNSYEIFVDVIDSKYNILLLSDYSHPDIAALKSVLSKNKHYSIESIKIEEFNGNIDKYNLVVLFGLAKGYEKINAIVDAKVPLLFFIGASANINQFNNLQNTLSIGGKNRFQEVTATENKQFSLFTISDELSKILMQFPPLHAPFGDYRFSANTQVLLHQKIGKITTEKPILFFQNSSNKKIGVFVGEGFWKWKLMEFSEQKHNDAFDELFAKTAQYLLLADDKSQFRLKYEYKVNANSPITFEAELYNESYEPITKNDISINIIDEKGKEYPFIFSKLTKSYHLNVGSFAVGEYSFVAKVDGTQLHKKGSFSVVPFQMEMMQTKANHQLLFNLANQSGGALFFPNQMDLLYEKIKNSDQNIIIIHNKEKVQEMINIPWILFILLLLILSEWFVRRFNGLY